MPFITYNVEKNFFDNLKKINLVKFYKFIHDIEDLNISNKAILVESEKNRTLKNLSIKSKELGNKIMESIKLTEIKIALDEAKKNNSPLPVTKIVDGYYEEVQKMGGSRWDTSSLIRRFRKKKI